MRHTWNRCARCGEALSFTWRRCPDGIEKHLWCARCDAQKMLDAAVPRAAYRQSLRRMAISLDLVRSEAGDMRPSI